jgi:hypothetical protein
MSLPLVFPFYVRRLLKGGGGLLYSSQEITLPASDLLDWQ